ncbi:hypothetical protein, partial [Saccharopolyspora sp. NPDC050642]|uniref:hypothetical protein n=1 Tax=Saccharopolyspora sp. NPDC050642 TaxID=3157099 RepID=UPI0034013D1E
RLRRIRHPIDVQLCGPRLRADQDEKRSMEIRGPISIEIAEVVHSRRRVVARHADVPQFPLKSKVRFPWKLRNTQVSGARG